MIMVLWIADKGLKKWFAPAVGWKSQLIAGRK